MLGISNYCNWQWRALMLSKASLLRSPLGGIKVDIIIRS